MITDGSAATTTADRKMSLDSMGVDDLELLEMARQSACIADSANRNQFIGEEGGAGGGGQKESVVAARRRMSFIMPGESLQGKKPEKPKPVLAAAPKQVGRQTVAAPRRASTAAAGARKNAHRQSAAPRLAGRNK